MELEKPTKRFLLICTNALPANLDEKTLSRLPFLGSQARQGYWAQVQIPIKKNPDEMYHFLFTGSADSQVESVPFWKSLENSGIKVSTIGLPLGFSQSKFTSVEDIQSHIQGDDWEFMTVFSNQVINNKSLITDELEHHTWQQWDKEIEKLALGAGQGTTVWVLALPDKAEDTAWLLAGGADVATVGKSGPVNLIDLAPTILWWLDVDPPPSMVGRILEEVKEVDSGLTDDEMDMLTDHLRGLGYLG